MDSKQEIRNYIGGFPFVKKIIALVLTLICLACVVFTVIKGTAEPPKPVQLTKDTGTYVQVYLDVVGVSNWVVDESHESNGKKTGYKYYVMLDESERNFYLARIANNSSYLVTTALRNYYDTGRSRPEPVRFEGELRKMDSEVRKIAMEVLELDEETFDRSFQNRVLYVGAVYNSYAAILAFFIALATGIAAGFMWIQGLKRSSAEKRSIQALERQNLLDNAALELGSAVAEQELDDRLRLGNRFVFGRGVGLAASLQDVVWCYQRKRTVEFVTIRSLMFGTSDGKLHAVRFKKREEGRVLELMNAIRDRSPDVILGYSAAQAQEFKARCKHR